jgi:hypothetical protein
LCIALADANTHGDGYGNSDPNAYSNADSYAHTDPAGYSYSKTSPDPAAAPMIG